MKRVLGTAGLALLAGILLACGDDGGGTSKPLPYMVDAAAGDDATGDGVTIPYKTITKALSTAGLGDTVTVAPGTYDREAFPIVVPPGVTLIGDEANKGNGTTPTVILGGGEFNNRFSVAVVPGDYSTIAGFTIANDNHVLIDNLFPAATSGVYLWHRIVVTLRNNRIVDCDQAVSAMGADRSVISGNEIVNNGEGLSFGGAGDDVIRVENNIIRANGGGVKCYYRTYADLGGGGTGSAGGNVIAGNTDYDLWTDFPTIYYAKNNFWDHVPPTVSNGATGFDIINVYGATIVVDGAALAP